MLIIKYGDLIKQSKPGHHLEEIFIAAYPNDLDLCIVNLYMEYVHRTKKLRVSELRLFRSTQEPHNSVSVDTIGRWIKAVISVFTGNTLILFTAHEHKNKSFHAF